MAPGRDLSELLREVRAVAVDDLYGAFGADRVIGVVG